MIALSSKSLNGSCGFMSSFYPIFCTICIVVLKEVNTIIDGPYMVQLVPSFGGN